MFFKNHFLAVADIIDARYRAYKRPGQNAADKGELCEIFIKDFLQESLGDIFKVFRGGKIIDCEGIESKQLDVILTGKRIMKLFGDKGIYPTETVYGAISITSTLTKRKLKACIEEFDSIPKGNFNFMGHGIYDEEFIQQSVDVWRTQIPYKCLFAYQGNFKEEWISDILNHNYKNPIAINSMPDLIIVNKVCMIEKNYDVNENRQVRINLKYTDFKQYKNYGVPFSKLLYHLNNLCNEELFLIPEFSKYFNRDMEA